MSESEFVSDLVESVVESFFETSNESGDKEWFAIVCHLWHLAKKLSLEDWILELNSSII